MSPNRQLEREVNEKLADCHQKLLAADVDRKESEREARLKETFSTLQKLFPGTKFPQGNWSVRSDFFNVIGVRGRVVDLCKPTSRKYEVAVSVILGRNIDAIVVDHEKTAIDCIEVSAKLLVSKLNPSSSVSRYSICAISEQELPLSFHWTLFRSSLSMTNSGVLRKAHVSLWT